MPLQFRDMTVGAACIALSGFLGAASAAPVCQSADPGINACSLTLEESFSADFSFGLPFGDDLEFLALPTFDEALGDLVGARISLSGSALLDITSDESALFSNVSLEAIPQTFLTTPTPTLFDASPAIPSTTSETFDVQFSLDAAQASGVLGTSRPSILLAMFLNSFPAEADTVLEAEVNGILGVTFLLERPTEAVPVPGSLLLMAGGLATFFGLRKVSVGRELPARSDLCACSPVFSREGRGS